MASQPEQYDPADKPWYAVFGPDDGEHHWQPLPSRGYVTLKLTPEEMPYDTFTCGTQVLPPGCHVREHTHPQNHELVFVYEGTGRLTLEGNTYDIEKGSMALFGRHASQMVENTGDEDLKLFFVVLPPGLENWFRGLGRPREVGQPMPEAFERPKDIKKLMEKVGVAPPPKK